MERHNRDALNKSLMERAPGSSPGDSREVTNLAGLPLPLPEKIRLPALQQRLHLPLPLHGARGRFPGGGSEASWGSRSRPRGWGPRSSGLRANLPLPPRLSQWEGKERRVTAAQTNGNGETGLAEERRWARLPWCSALPDWLEAGAAARMPGSAEGAGEWRGRRRVG